eukprot:gb/GECH01006771.1/.p1 GENE.gb/GECH01006771.1/~~gb/GECH01006771.1/.p1  ORF type:complete len:392 (+),score=78.58 gb/GECH01006771.1/:1-1176(+)
MAHSRRSSRREQRDPRNLFISGISDDTTDNDLREVLSKFGELKSVRIPRNMDTQRHRGFAFVTFEDLDAADDARNARTPIQVLGRDINIEVAKEGPRDRGTPRRFPRHRPYPPRSPRDPYYYDPRQQPMPPSRRHPPMDPMMEEIPYEEWDPRDRRAPRDMRLPSRRGPSSGGSGGGGGYPPSPGMSRVPPEYPMPYPPPSVPRGYVPSGSHSPYLDYPMSYGMEPPARMRYGDYYSHREHDPRRDRSDRELMEYDYRYDRRYRRSYDRRDHKRRDYRRASDERSVEDDDYHHHRGNRRRSEDRSLGERGSVSPPHDDHHHHYDHHHHHPHRHRRSPERSASPPPPPPSDDATKDGREYASMPSDGADNHHDRDGYPHDVESLEHHTGDNY